MRKNLIQDVTKRWWYTWRMLKIISALSTPIDALIASDQNPSYKFDSSAKGNCDRNRKFLLPMATSQLFLKVQQYATASLVPFCL